MTNETKQTAVEWQFEQLFNSFEKFNNGEYTFDEYLKKNLEIREQSKEMEKEQTRDAIKEELKLIGNHFDVGKLDAKEQSHHIRFTSILKDRFDNYNETYGGNK